MIDPDDPLDAAYANAAANNPYYPPEDAADRDAAGARRDRRHEPVELDVAADTELRLRQLAAEEFDGADLDAVVQQLLDEHQERREHKQQHR